MYHAVRGLLLLGVVLAAAFPAAGADLNEQAENYRQFALTHAGDARAGQRLFEADKNLACTNCHRITGAEKSGPNLDGIADKYSRRELIEQILRPAASIKPGYEQATVTMRDGRSIVGRINRATKSLVRLIDANGKNVDVLRDDIDRIDASAVSMMPDSLAFSASPAQFADLIAYLETLRFAVASGFQGPQQPIEITRLERPVELRPIHSTDIQFANPVWCGALPGVPGQMLVLEQQEAKIWRLEQTGGITRRHLFLDLTGQVKYGQNWGLVCLAFHPQFKTNRRYFLKYEVEERPAVKTTVVERRASDDLLSDAGVPSRRLFAVEQPAFNHNGGCIAFGPDSFLYIGFGDGGFQRDPNGNGQNLHIAHGSMLRIDVDHRDQGKPYAIPADNPFLEAHRRDPAILPEIWAIGFREPWRFSFDPKNGDLWVGDVGQDTFEEICRVKAGENHGWNVYEGFEPFSEEYRRADAKFTFPLFAYPHRFGVSVTGGHVYRGSRSRSFAGVYIFGDYDTRRIWALKEKDGRLMAVRELGESPQHIASFGLDENGEIIVVGYEGKIFHLDLSRSTFR
jgi:putative heme-binding domain-containing protein